MALRPGMYVVPAPLRPVMVFVHNDDQELAAGFQQNSLQRVRAGDEAEVAFDAIPGRVFKGKVRSVIDAIAVGQLQATGSLQDLGASDPGGRAVALIDLTDDLRDKHLLLLIDNCEHLVDLIAPLVEAILRQAPNVHILATSREALRAEGEWVYRLKPMGTPPLGDVLTAAEALQFDAVQLFVERASASLDGYRLTDADAPAAAEICRRLDGLPLAIELIAARIDLFGVRGLATMLNDHFLLVSEGQRTAQPRQQNLLGALDWSYRLLSSVEQTILCRLAVFHGDFTLDAAVAVATGNGVSQEQVYSGILTLSSKSLITTDVTGASQEHHHRLLHVTRAFVAQKLAQSGERNRIVRRHAEYLCQLFAQAEAEWEKTDRQVWLATYTRTIDDVRTALDWAFSPEGDAAIGVTLTASAVPIGFQLSLIEEVKAWLERALLHAPLLAVPQTLAEMRLNVGLGRLAHNMGLPQPGQTTGFDRAIELSLQLGQAVHRTEPLIALAALHLTAGKYGGGIARAREAHAIAEASGDAKAILAVNRIAAQVHHFNGDHTTAHQLATLCSSTLWRRSRLPITPCRSIDRCRCALCWPVSRGCAGVHSGRRRLPGRVSSTP